MKLVVATLATLAVVASAMDYQVGAKLATAHKRNLLAARSIFGTSGARALQQMGNDDNNGGGGGQRNDDGGGGFDPSVIVSVCQAEPNTPCCAAFMEAFATVSECQADLDAVMEIRPNTTQAQMQANCRAPCYVNIVNTLNQATGTDGVCPLVNYARFFISSPCVRSAAGDFCMPAMAALDAPGRPAVGTFNILCNGCFQAVANSYLNFITAFGSSDALEPLAEGLQEAMAMFRAAGDMMCSKDPTSGQYCMLVLPDEPPAPVSGGGSGMPQYNQTALQVLCSPCARRLLSLEAAMKNQQGGRNDDDNNNNNNNNGMGPIEQIIRFGCAPQPGNANGFCYTQFTAGMETLQGLGSSCETALRPTNATCSTQCRDGFSSLSNTMGCCLTNFFLFLNATGGDVPLDVVRNVAVNVCGLPATNLNGPCRGAAQRPLVARLRNVRYSWVIQNRAAFETTFKTDIGNNAGIESSFITINSITEGSVVVDFTIQADSDAATSAAASLVGNAISAGTLSLPSTTTYLEANAAAAFVDPAAGIEVDDDSDDSAAAASVSGAVAALVALVAARHF